MSLTKIIDKGYEATFWIGDNGQIRKTSYYNPLGYSHPSYEDLQWLAGKIWTERQDFRQRYDDVLVAIQKIMSDNGLVSAN